LQDQAESLRQLVGRLNSPVALEKSVPPSFHCRVITVTSGKGGVGKTNLSVNFALALAAKGKRVLLFDGDMGLANVDVMLGMMPQHTLLNVLNGQKTLSEIVLEGPGGIRVVASGSGGVQELADLNEAHRGKFLEALLELQHQSDLILIDTGAGLHRNVLAFVLAAEEVVIVTTPEPTALMDAYGMIKVLYREKRNPVISVVVNMAGNQIEADEAGKKLVILSKRFLNLEIDYLGFVPRDPAMIKAVREQKPVLLSAPSSPAAISLTRLAGMLLTGNSQRGEGNLINFFKKVTQIFGGKNHD
jgi:flagellar biosynthesis protein FlhG